MPFAPARAGVVKRVPKALEFVLIGQVMRNAAKCSDQPVVLTLEYDFSR